MYTETEEVMIFKLVESLNKGSSGDATTRVDIAVQQLEQLREYFSVNAIFTMKGIDKLKWDYIYPEHNEEYLQECIENLKEKGVEINVRL